MDYMVNGIVIEISENKEKERSDAQAARLEAYKESMENTAAGVDKN